MEKSALQKLFEETEFEPRGYSGRGMRGQSCLAVTGDDIGALLFALVHGVTDENRAEVAESVSNLTTDALGRGKIFYFPGTSFVDEEEEDEDELGDLVLEIAERELAEAAG